VLNKADREQIRREVVVAILGVVIGAFTTFLNKFIETEYQYQSNLTVLEYDDSCKAGNYANWAYDENCSITAKVTGPKTAKGVQVQVVLDEGLEFASDDFNIKTDPSFAPPNPPLNTSLDNGGKVSRSIYLDRLRAPQKVTWDISVVSKNRIDPNTQIARTITSQDEIVQIRGGDAWRWKRWIPVGTLTLALPIIVSMLLLFALWGFRDHTTRRPPMRLRKTRVLVLLGVAAGVGFAAAPVKSQSITGTVFDSHNHTPIADAVVTILEPPKRATKSQDDGKFSLDNVPTGTLYTVTASSPRFFTGRLNQVQPGQKIEVPLTANTYSRNGSRPYAEVSQKDALRLLPIAKETNDTTGQYLLVNRLAMLDPAHYKTEADTFEAGLKMQPAKVSGMVTSSDNSVPNTDLELTNTMTGDVVTTKTDAFGKYKVALFPAGAYVANLKGKNISKAMINVEANFKPNIEVYKDIKVPPV
jgi:hypothetical protein